MNEFVGQDGGLTEVHFTRRGEDDVYLYVELYDGNYVDGQHVIGLLELLDLNDIDFANKENSKTVDSVAQPPRESQLYE
jgi:hypothetical protein